MDRHRKLSNSSKDSDASDQSIDRPPFLNCDGNQLEEIKQRKLEDFQRNFEGLKSKFGKNDEPLTRNIKKLNGIADEFECAHRNTTVGSLVGSSIGAVGGITSIVGLAFSPFTLGASLSLTVAGAVIGAAGGVTSVTSSLTNMYQQTNYRKTIENTIIDTQEKMETLNHHLEEIYKFTKYIKQLDTGANHLKCQTSQKTLDKVLNFVKIASLTEIGIICAESAKEIRVFVKTVNAMRGPAQAAKAVRATAENTKFIRTTAAVTGALSGLFLALDVYSIVQDSIEISEINQGTKNMKAEGIKSETLKFIHHLRETASKFQHILDDIKRAIDLLTR